MGEVSTIGLDIAKSVFQVHGVDDAGAVVLRRRVSRAKVLDFFGGLSPCLVGIEACPSAHYWSRELQALGHTVRLMPPSYVKAYLKRSKNDANDAAAICEAVTRPSMRFVPIKTKDQQTGLMLHRTRQLLVRQRTPLSTSAFMPGTDRVKTAGGWSRSLALAPLSPPRWLPRSATGSSSAQDAISPPGSDWCPNSIRPAARSGSAASPSRAIATCDGCWLPGPWPLSDMRDSTAPSGRGSHV